MIGELLAIHPPAVVLEMSLPQARALLRAVFAARSRQEELLAAMFGAVT